MRRSEVSLRPIEPSLVQAVLFDIDGTLADTDDQAVDAVARRLHWLRWAAPARLARRLVMALETPANAALTGLDRIGLDGPLIRQARRRPRVPGLRPIGGAADTLAELSSRYRMAIVTTRSHRDARAFLDQHQLTDYFGALVTGESTWRLKPHPSPVRLAALRLGVSVERCVMVGDTTVDVLAARRAGAWAVGVLCGFGEETELRRAGAHAILEHTSLLPSLL